MQVFNPRCFEDQNIYLAERALTPEIGGVISESVITEGGWCRETVLRWCHYRPVQDDYEPVGHVDLLDCGITWFVGLNIFAGLMPAVLGRILTGAIVGGGSELLHKIIEAAEDLAAKWVYWFSVPQLQHTFAFHDEGFRHSSRCG
jgi:hypothetical protein